MKIKTYILGIFFLLAGIFFALFPNNDPIFAMVQRFGHIIIIIGLFVIISNIIITSRDKKFSKNIDSLFKNENSKYLMVPWKIINKNNTISLGTDEKSYYYMIIVAIMIAGGFMYFVIPRLINFIPGVIIQTPDTYIALLISGFILSALFLGVAIGILIKGRITIIDYNKSMIFIIERDQLRYVDTDEYKFLISFPLNTLSKSQIKEEGYYRIKIPIENMTGDASRVKNWIENGEYILIQSSNSDFIKDLHENLIKKMEND